MGIARKMIDKFLTKLVSDAPDRTISAAAGLVLDRRRIELPLAHRIRAHLSTVGSRLYREGRLGYSFDAEGRSVPTIGVDCTALYLYRRWPVSVRFVRSQNSANYTELACIRGTLDLRALVEESCRTHHRRRNVVITHQGRGFFDRGEDKAVAPTSVHDEDMEADDAYMLNTPIARKRDFLWPSPALLAMMEDGRRWMDSKEWCEDRGLAWRRGWLEHGAPGNGKTANARAVAEELDLPLHCFLLASMTDQDFRSAWDKALQSQPCMVLVEDFDDTIQGRLNIRSAVDGVSFSTIINCVDGAQRAQGVLLVMTTNDLASVDPALGRPEGSGQRSSRPGRIDRVFHVEAPSYEGRLHVATRVCGGDVEQAKDLASRGGGMSLAQFQSMCQDAALDLYWAGKLST